MGNGVDKGNSKVCKEVGYYVKKRWFECEDDKKVSFHVRKCGMVNYNIGIYND